MYWHDYCIEDMRHHQILADFYAQDQVASRGVLLFIHGGGFTGGSKEQFLALAPALSLACNYLSVSINYRLAPESIYPAPVEDVLTVIKFIRQHAQELQTDAENIILVGGSPGGMIALSALMNPIFEMDPPITKAILLNPIIDLVSFVTHNADQLEPVQAFEPDRALWADISPTNLAKDFTQNNKQILIIHGGDDDIIPVDAIRDFAHKFDLAGGAARVDVIPGKGHAWFNSLYEHPVVIDSMITFLQEIHSVRNGKEDVIHGVYEA